VEKNLTLRERAWVLGLRCALISPALVVALGWTSAFAQQLVETTVPLSDRITIDLSAGMPSQSHWLYIKDQDNSTFATPTFNDSSWTQVGIPHGANYLTTFLNTTSGGGDGDMDGGNNWYRLHFTLGTQYANSKVMVEFEGAHTGAQVYIIFRSTTAGFTPSAANQLGTAQPGSSYTDSGLTAGTTTP
jgi:hypothetical protein